VTTDWTAVVRSPAGTKYFSSSLCHQTGSEAGPFPGGKDWPGPDSDHSPASSAEVKNE
jgi:hypothetical protein